MKNILFNLRKLSLALALLACGSGLRAQTSAAESIVSNGSLEDPSGGWPNGNGVSIQEEGGNHFLRLEQPEPLKQVQAYRKIALSAGASSLEVSFRVRYQDIKPGAQNWHTGRLVLHFRDANGALLQPDPKPISFVGCSHDWEDRALTLKVPEGAVALEFMPALFQTQSGTLDLDDVKIVPQS